MAKGLKQNSPDKHLIPLYLNNVISLALITQLHFVFIACMVNVR